MTVYVKCGKPAAFRYTWPGRDEAFICEGHSGKLRDVSEAMGLHLQLIETSSDEANCGQRVVANLRRCRVETCGQRVVKE